MIPDLRSSTFVMNIQQECNALMFLQQVQLEAQQQINGCSVRVSSNNT